MNIRIWSAFRNPTIAGRPASQWGGRRCVSHQLRRSITTTSTNHITSAEGNLAISDPQPATAVPQAEHLAAYGNEGSNIHIPLVDTAHELIVDLEDLRTRFDAMTDERDVLQSRIYTADRELEAFQQRVVDVATEYATEHN